MSQDAQAEALDMFAPPVNHAMKVLDRSFFQKTINTSAARIFRNQDISRIRTDLLRSQDSLKNRVQTVCPDPDATRSASGGKCVLLKPNVIYNGTAHVPRPLHSVFAESELRQIRIHGAPSFKSSNSRAPLV